jgi:hypothetical protein
MKTVVCVMLANGRPEMVKRAVAAFHAQEYPKKRLLVWSTGEGDDLERYAADDVSIRYSGADAAIGTLRNRANTAAVSLFKGVELFAHWDSDDWSHPRRLVEQVELLENAAADLVGYRECLFWDSRHVSAVSAVGALGDTRRVNEAWIYRSGNPAGPIGSSFLYARAAWDSVRFPDRHAGEDTLWLLKGSGRFKVHAVPSTWGFRGLPSFEPRMICSIHGANTAGSIDTGRVEWKREPLFDLYCRTRMRTE